MKECIIMGYTIIVYTDDQWEVFPFRGPDRPVNDEHPVYWMQKETWRVYERIPQDHHAMSLQSVLNRKEARTRTTRHPWEAEWARGISALVPYARSSSSIKLLSVQLAGNSTHPRTSRI
jgi:hypothetical protein